MFLFNFIDKNKEKNNDEKNESHIFTQLDKAAKSTQYLQDEGSEIKSQFSTS